MKHKTTKPLWRRLEIALVDRPLTWAATRQTRLGRWLAGMAAQAYVAFFAMLILGSLFFLLMPAREAAMQTLWCALGAAAANVIGTTWLLWKAVR